ncbi:MAG: hypothetical protein ABIZ57_01990, partial [Candidatus Limnocylindria bacterium]
ERQVPGGAVAKIELPSDDAVSPRVTPSDEGGEAPDWLRAPRYAPDGEALAFVDPSGSVGILDLVTDTLAMVEFDAQAPPIWLPDGSGVLLTGRAAQDSAEVRPVDAPVPPLEPSPDATVGVLDRSGLRIEESGFGARAAVAAVAADGRIAYLRGDGSVRLTDDPRESGDVPSSLSGERVGAVAFAPGEDAMVVVIILSESLEHPREGRIERIELAGTGRDVLINEGWRPRWLP